MTVQQRKSCGDCTGGCIKCRYVEYHSVRVKQNALDWKELTLRERATQRRLAVAVDPLDVGGHKFPKNLGDGSWN